MLIHKSYIGLFTQFTTNIEDMYINPYIQNSEVDYARPTLGDQMVDDILLISNYNPTAWNGATNYVVFTYTVKNDIVYKWLQAGQDKDPVTEVTYWQPSALGTFWWNYVRPWIVFKVMENFVLFHGVNFTQSGVRVNESNTDFSVDGATRAAISAKHGRTAAVRANKMDNYLCSINWTINSIKYEVDCTKYKKTAGSFRISAAGRKRC